MDPQLIQQLTQVFQQGLQILQAAGGAAGADPGMSDPGMDDPTGGGMPAMGDGDDMAMDDMGGMGDGGDMGDDGSLHDRVSKLENHTGLNKSARSIPISDRLDVLEERWLGEAYDGPVGDRIKQLEEAMLQKSAELAPKSTQTSDEAPDVIPLDALIKSAVDLAVQKALGAQRPATADEDLPSVESLRKSARQQRQTTVSQRRGGPTTVSTASDLIKSAQGWTEEDLDEPVGMGDVLQMQYRALRYGGVSINFEDDDD